LLDQESLGALVVGECAIGIYVGSQAKAAAGATSPASILTERSSRCAKRTEAADLLLLPPSPTQASSEFDR